MWTGNEAIAHNVAPIMALLAFGTMLNSLMHVPYMLTLAYGWPGFALRQNFVAVVLLVPAILWVAPRYGAIGAAWIWIILNSGYVLIGMHFVHFRLLPKEKMRWYGRDVAIPGVVSFMMVAFIWLAKPAGASRFVMLVWLLSSGAIIVAVTWLTTFESGRWLNQFDLLKKRLFQK